jgi:hypothetical protein
MKILLLLALTLLAGCSMLRENPDDPIWEKGLADRSKIQQERRAKEEHEAVYGPSVGSYITDDDGLNNKLKKCLDDKNPAKVCFGNYDDVWSARVELNYPMADLRKAKLTYRAHPEWLSSIIDEVTYNENQKISEFTADNLKPYLLMEYIVRELHKEEVLAQRKQQQREAAAHTAAIFQGIVNKAASMTAPPKQTNCTTVPMMGGLETTCRSW